MKIKLEYMIKLKGNDECHHIPNLPRSMHVFAPISTWFPTITFNIWKIQKRKCILELIQNKLKSNNKRGGSMMEN